MRIVFMISLNSKLTHFNLNSKKYTLKINTGFKLY